MTRRKTGCLLYPGSTRSECYGTGATVARVTIGTDRSLCGKQADAGELPEAEWPAPETTTRPTGLCPRCWGEHRRGINYDPDKETKRMSATCYLCNLPTVRADGDRPNAHPECETEAARLGISTELHAEDIPSVMAHMGTFEAEWDVSAEYRAFRAKLAESGAS